MGQVCAACNADMSDDDVECPECGAKVAEETSVEETGGEEPEE